MKKLKFPELIGEMARHGDTQKTLAKLIGISHGSVCRRLSGKSEWKFGEIEKICEHYNKDYYELFKTENE